ncbi:MAG: Fic family protein [Eubacteriaceae bacterium]|nr:Fic family protein [Eubacteriaceae bacterium]
MENRSGKLISNLSGEITYQSFLPAKLPPMPAVELDEEGLKLLIRANRELAYLEGLSSNIPSLPLFISMYVRKEALLSSQIEGTQATLEDILDPAAEANTDWNISDVVNYIKATEFALDRLKKLPLCNRLIKETHAVLMPGVRGQEKSPGEFRTSQNWIGGAGSTLKNAGYIPPAPADMIECMSALEKYMNAENDETDPLIKAGLLHYQFETIHPFLDGNGRIGRLLITLYLMEQKVMQAPALYISYFLKRNRIEYYDRMSEVRRKGDYEQWIKFFLNAIYESAEDAVLTINQLSVLHDECMGKLTGISRNQNLTAVFEYLEQNPIIEIKKTSVELGIAYNTVAKAVNTLIEKDILVENQKTGRTRTFSYERYLEILRKDTI